MVIIKRTIAMIHKYILFYIIFVVIFGMIGVIIGKYYEKKWEYSDKKGNCESIGMIDMNISDDEEEYIRMIYSAEDEIRIMESVINRFDRREVDAVDIQILVDLYNQVVPEKTKLESLRKTCKIYDIVPVTSMKDGITRQQVLEEREYIMLSEEIEKSLINSCETINAVVVEFNKELEKLAAKYNYDIFFGKKYSNGYMYIVKVFVYDIYNPDRISYYWQSYMIVMILIGGILGVYVCLLWENRKK